MTRAIAVLVTLLCLTASASAVGLPDVAIALHADSVQLYDVSQCQFTTEISAPLYTMVFVHVIICGHMYNSPTNDGFTGVEYDLYWPPGINPTFWDNYAPLCIGEPGSGVTQAWGPDGRACQNDLHPYIAGVFTIQILDDSPTYVEVVAHPDTDIASAVDCYFMQWVIDERLGRVVINGTDYGYNPCLCVDPPNPVEDMAWGSIKALYR